MHPVSKTTRAPRRKRLAHAWIAASLCMLIGACGNDGDNNRAADTRTLNSTDTPANAITQPALASANSSTAEPALPALTFQTPARPTSDAGAALSAAAPAPLATPVIHTVD